MGEREYLKIIMNLRISYNTWVDKEQSISIIYICFFVH
jgi:hypothetical protein